jgi:hypothetical protein
MPPSALVGRACGGPRLNINCCAMQQATDPRQLAELCRRLANVPTSGGHRADRVLHALAAKLDHEAALAERMTAEPQDSNRR